MSLYDLSKDMLVQLIQNINNYEKLDKGELKEKRKYIDSILIKQKGKLLDKNIEHKEIIKKHRDYFLSVDVDFDDNEEHNEEHAVLSSPKGTIIVYFYEEEIYCDANCYNYSESINFEKLREISEDLETTLNLISLLEFLEEIQ